MKSIRFDKNSMFLILLMGNIMQPAMASAIKGNGLSYQRKNVSPLQQEIANRLEERGLETDAAAKKAAKLFAMIGNDVAIKLAHLQNHENLSFSYESLLDALARRALFEQSIDFGEFVSLAGFVQSIYGRPLTEKETTALKQVALLNQAVA